MVNFISFHINRAERSGGAEVLAGTAADAAVFVHGGHFYRTIRSVVIHHLDGSRRAMALAVAARNTVAQRNAVLLDPYGVADVNHRLFLTREVLDGAGRANMAALHAFGTAVAALKRHGGLHEVLQVGGGPKDIVRALRHAELAGRAMLLQMLG